MKFPLQERPFDQLQFSSPRLKAIERLTHDLIQANVSEFNDFVHVHNRSLPKHKFRPVKKHVNVTIYKELTARHERVFGPLIDNHPQASTAPLLPKLVAAGTVRGRVEDMVLGAAVRDARAVVVKTAYVDDEMVDCAVREIQGATLEDPFRHLAIKWVVKSHPTGLNAVVAPRDMILVQSSGLIASGGTTIGYYLLHSIDEIVPEFMSLENKYGILRARISSMFMFRQLTPDVIECYTTNYVEPNGSAPEAVTIISTAASMGGIWKWLECAQNIKLSWVLQNNNAYMGHHHHHHHHNAPPPTISPGDACKICHKKSTLTTRLTSCTLCDAHVCSKCRVTKKLSRANFFLELRTDKYEFCKTCLYRAVNEDAVRIALERDVGVPITPWLQCNEPMSRTVTNAGIMLVPSVRSQTSYSHRSEHKPRGKSHQRDTFSTVSSTSGMYGDYSSSSYDPIDSMAFSRLVDVTRFRAASLAESTVTDLDFEGCEFHDSDAILEPLEDDDECELEQYALSLAHQSTQWELAPQDCSRQNGQFASHSQSSGGSSPQLALHHLSSRADIDKLRDGEDHVVQLYNRIKSLQLAADRTFELTRDNERQISQRGTR